MLRLEHSKLIKKFHHSEKHLVVLLAEFLYNWFSSRE